MKVAAMPPVLFYFSRLPVCLAGFLLFEHSVGMGYQIFSIVLQIFHIIHTTRCVLLPHEYRSSYASHVLLEGASVPFVVAFR